MIKIKKMNNLLKLHQIKFKFQHINELNKPQLLMEYCFKLRIKNVIYFNEQLTKKNNFKKFFSKYLIFYIKLNINNLFIQLIFPIEYL